MLILAIINYIIFILLPFPGLLRGIGDVAWLCDFRPYWTRGIGDGA
jgi:hypothetical protein